MTRPVRPRSAVLLVAFLLAAVKLRLAWPHSDPPAGLSWSGGIYTDPAYNYLAARYAADPPGQPTVTLTVRLIYPLLTTVVRSLGRVTPVTPIATTALSVGLGVLTLLLLAGLVRRTAGRRAVWIALALGAVFYWLGLFSRVLMAEHVTALLLVLGARAAVGRHARHHAACAALLATATLFGKYTALGSSAGILAFVLLRRPGRRSLLAMAAAVSAVAALWLAAIFLPHRSETLAWTGSYTSVGRAGPPILDSPIGGILEVFRTFRNSYVVHHAPGITLCGGFFVVWTLGHGRARRRRLDDGTAVFALWFAGAFLLHALMAYTPPRYFIPPVYALLGAAPCQCAGMLRSPPLPVLRRPDTWAPLAFASLFVGVACVRTAELVNVFLVDTLLVDRQIRGDPIPAILSWSNHVRTVEQNLLWGTVLGGLMFAAAAIFLRGRAERPFSAAPRLAGILIAGMVGLNLGQWTWWAAHRTYRIDTIRHSLAELVGPGGIVLGAYAPLFTEGSDVRAVWAPLSPAEGGGGLLAERGVTHVILPEPSSPVATLEAQFPGITPRMRLVHTWRVPLGSVKRLHLYRVDGGLPGRHPGYEPTPAELACEAGIDGRFRECLDLLQRHYDGGGAETPELLFYEGVSDFALGERDRAAERLDRARTLDPDAPDILRSVGLVAEMRGDVARARESWRRSLRIDPADGDLARRYRALFADSTGTTSPADG